MIDIPTMDGFDWSPRDIDPSHRELSTDLYCVRDAVCRLLGWELGSSEWAKFIEAPTADDVDRLTDHLGLDWCDPERQPETLQDLLDHPGIAVYAFHRDRMSHYQYQPHIRYLQALPPEYMIADPNPELFRIIADLRQRPHGER